MTPSEKKRYFEFIHSMGCVNCGAEPVQVSHYVGMSGHHFGRGGSSKAHDLVVAPHCLKCHTAVDARMLWALDDQDKFVNQLSHSEGMLVHVVKTIIAAKEAGVLKID